MATRTAVKALVLKDRVILAEGTWNGVFYPAEELSPIVPILNRIVEEQRKAERRGDEVDALRLRNATSLFWDHDERCTNWLGDVRNFRWDAKQKAIIGDLYVVDEDAARKIQFQEARGFTSWGISPSVVVDRFRGTARNIRFMNIAVVLEPAGGVRLMLSKPRLRGGDSMGKKKKEKLGLEEKAEEKDEDTKEEETKEEEKSEEAAEESTEEATSEDEAEEEAELEIENEEGSEDEKEGEEEMAATLDDVMNAVKVLTRVVGGLVAAMKSKGIGYPDKEKREEQSALSIEGIDKDKLLGIASAIGTEYRALENATDGATDQNLRTFLSKVVALFPAPEKLETDGPEDEEKKEEEKPAEGDEKPEGEEEAAEEKKPEEGGDSEAEPKGEGEKSEESKEEMARKVLDAVEDLKSSIPKLVSEEIKRRVRPRRKGKIADQVEKLARERKDLRARIEAEPDPLKRLDMYARATFGPKKN